MAILVRIQKLANMGDCQLQGFENDWFVADSFSFGIERELKESGEKAGTSDINIGVGELQECSISKSMDRTSAYLAQAAINGNSLGYADIAFVETAGGKEALEGKPICYLYYRLQRCYVKSWSTSGDADDRPTEEVAFLYNKIGFWYAYTADGQMFTMMPPMVWDNVKGVKWDDSEVPKPNCGVGEGIKF